MKTFRRATYIAGDCTHREYYGQYVDEGVKDKVKSRINIACLDPETDLNFNKIRLNQWDQVFCNTVPSHIARKMEANGDWATPAGLVCIAKEAAQQILEESA